MVERVPKLSSSFHATMLPKADGLVPKSTFHQKSGFAFIFSVNAEPLIVSVVLISPVTVLIEGCAKVSYPQKQLPILKELY